jgi:hypothetical protein
MDLTLIVPITVIVALLIGFILGSWWESEHDPDSHNALTRSNQFLRARNQRLQQDNDELCELMLRQRTMLRVLGCELGALHEDLIEDLISEDLRSRPQVAA